MLEGISRQIWNLPVAFPKAGLHALLEYVGLNIPSIWEVYSGAAIRSWTQILNDEGALGTTARASLQTTSAKFRHWPLEMAFHSHRGRIPICSSIVSRNMSTLLMADLHPVGGPEIWSGNQISTSISSRIPVHLDEDGCPLEVQPFPSRRSCFENSPLYGNMGSITGPKLFVVAQTVARISWIKGNFNGQTHPPSSHFRRRSPEH